MTMSNKPVIWLPFAAGGMVAALVLPALMLIVLLSTAGGMHPPGLEHATLLGFLHNPVAAAVLFLVLTLPLWHAAHRLRMTLQDLGVRTSASRRVVVWLCYGGAAAINVVLIWALASAVLVHA
ncbi:MAG TPA: fumarate reductase subunit FrdD [Gammaproteobacteria bacterium]|nr:fumarate reductase subunit FrdD [Gammaproteobacteria bacterium]